MPMKPQRPAHALWSFQLGRVAGIPIRVHVTFFALLAWIGASQWFAGEGARAAVEAVVLMCLVFVVVVVHELSHALVGRRFGVETRDILLLPIGGIASLDHIPKRPGQELLVALAGPATNIVIAAALFAFLAFTGRPHSIDTLMLPQGALVAKLAWVNVTLAVFNLLPAFPMDGGRVLRALLAMTMPRGRATRAAARVGRVFAIGLGILGLLANPLLVLIAVFVWVAAGAEAQQSDLDARIAGRPAREAMVRDFRSLAPTISLGHAAAAAVGGWQRDFPVIAGGDVSGVLTRAALLDALAHEDPNAPIASAVTPGVVTVGVDEPLDAVIARMRDEHAPMAMVADHGSLVGIITPESVVAFLELLSARPATA